jgi:transcriptional regulator with XRE-family HTH domain
VGSDSESPVEAVSSPLAGVGHQLRQARQAAGISVREMARRVDVSPSFISQVELGRTKPSVGTLYSIASELGVPLDDLMPIGQAVPALPEVASDERRTLVQRGVLRPFGADASSADPGSPVQRADRRHELRMGNAIWGRLTADHDPDNDFLHVVYAPGGESCPVDNMIHHRGREYGYLISGTLEVQVGFNHYQLNVGDSISFASMTPHRLHNPADSDSVSLWMVVGRGGTPVL